MFAVSSPKESVVVYPQVLNADVSSSSSDLHHKALNPVALFEPYSVLQGLVPGMHPLFA